MDGPHGVSSRLGTARAEAYETGGETELANNTLQQFLTARYGSVGESKAKVGELPFLRQAFRAIQSGLYSG